MPDNVASQEASEIKENNSLTKSEDEATIKRFDELTTKVNDFYLKPRPPLNDDPVFELFDKVDKMRD
jgi:hypothetical protein